LSSFYMTIQLAVLIHQLGLLLSSCASPKKQRGSPFNQALKWSIQAAEAIAYIHTKAVIQGDIGCYNFLLGSDGDLKLCDFAGSSIDGRDVRVGYSVRSQL